MHGSMKILEKCLKNKVKINVNSESNDKTKKFKFRLFEFIERNKWIF
jgi:hypothetical protein